MQTRKHRNGPARFGSFNKGATKWALSGRNFDGLSEVYVSGTDGSFKKVSNFTDQIKHWNTPVNEVIEWKSKDGARSKVFY